MVRVGSRILDSNMLAIQVILDFSAIEYSLHVTAKDAYRPSIVSVPIDHILEEAEEVRLGRRWECMILGRVNVFEDVSQTKSLSSQRGNSYHWICSDGMARARWSRVRGNRDRDLVLLG
jgi:hypothetical protein